MAFDLTLTSAGYNSSGKFGSSLNAGYGEGSNSLPAVGNPFTIEFWLKNSSTSGAAGVPVGEGDQFYLLQNGGSGGWDLTLTGGFNISGVTSCLDTNWHHIRICHNGVTNGANSTRYFVDGVLQGTSSISFPNGRSNPLGIRCFGGVGGYVYNGEIDEVAVWDSVLSTANFTPPTVATSNTATGLLALYHLDGNGVDSAGISSGDTTPPNLTSPTGAQTGSTTASGTVTTDEANGTLYSLATTNATETAATVKASGATQTITSTGSKSVTATGLTPSTTYYFHYVHRDAAGNDSSVSNSASFTTTAADTTAPTLSSPTGTSTGTSTASGTVTTDEGNGTLYSYVSTNATETAATVKSSATTQTVTSTGSKSASASGLLASTTYYFHYVHRDAAGNDSTVANSASFTTDAATGAYDPTKILFSPYNWNVDGSAATTINSGAYFKTIFGGASCALSFDMTGVIYVGKALEYRIDGGPWTYADLAASITLTIPADVATPSTGKHELEVRANFVTFDNTKWASAPAGIKLTGITLDAGKTLTKPAERPRNVLIYGDSITEGYHTTQGFTCSAGYSYAPLMAEILGAELGNVSFTGQGFVSVGNGSIPVLPTAYNLNYPGSSRSFSPAPDVIILNEGTNDGSSTTAAVTTVINGLLAATPGTTKIAVLRPFGGNRASEIQAAVAAIGSARVVYVDTTGFFVPTATGDMTHPLAYDNRVIGPKVAESISAVIDGAPTLVSRTVSVTLGDTSGAAASLTGLKVAFYDEASPDLHTVPRYQSAVQTTNGSGVLTFAVNSSLAVGGTGHLIVLGAAGVHFNGTVVVS